MNKILSKLPFKILKTTAVSGGDINKTYKLEAVEGNFFMKVNSLIKYPELFKKEANGIKSLAQSDILKTPRVVTYGESDNYQYLILEWLQAGNETPESQVKFGRQLATMHQKPQPFFGFTEDNYLGTWRQPNTQHTNWQDFYTECRIMPLVKLIVDNRTFYKENRVAAENFCSRIGELFPDEVPALLHGDLWGGNYISLENEDTALIDPAVYYGHREMDLGMSRLFGGFSAKFYEGYNEVYPLEQNWQERLPYSQLYPLLFHAYAFGGNYINSVKEILKRF
ncbi:fructosamine kinase family protein [Flavobacterium rhizosphaerae]|uniref:Fructosamine kinase family protein n=1 Tax=Flavobacterium rhizosphaerae TaxID=3163298 RepID=A0ABW8YY62_9FLAO